MLIEERREEKDRTGERPVSTEERKDVARYDADPAREDQTQRARHLTNREREERWPIG